MELSEAAKYSNGIKANFGLVLKTELMAVLAGNPLFNIPIVGMFIKRFIFGWLDKAMESARLAVFFKFIDMRVADQKKSYTKAVLDYENAKLKGDINEIERTKKIMLGEFDNFVKFNRI